MTEWISKTSNAVWLWTQGIWEHVVDDPSRLVGVAGAVLLVAGARFYRLATFTPGLVIGVFVALQITESASADIRMFATILLGLIGAVITVAVERLAIVLAGALLLGGVSHALCPVLIPGEETWYVTAGSAALGALIFPKVFRRLLFILSALGGAMCLAWAMGRTDDVLLIGGLWLFGTITQWLTRKRSNAR